MSNQHLNNDGFIAHVVEIFEDAEPKSVVHYAVGSFLETVREHGVEIFDEDSLRLWMAAMYMKGMKMKTVQRYLGKLHALYKSFIAGGAGEKGMFANMQKYLNTAYELHDEDVSHNVGFVKSMLDKEESKGEHPSLAIFFYLLYNADATVLDLADATLENAPQYCPQVADIVKSQDGRHGQKYLFKLEQRQVRPAQIFRNVTEGLTAVMTEGGMKSLHEPIRDEITALWVNIAMKCGIDICCIRSIIPAVPHQYLALSIIKKSELSRERLQEIICRVADTIDDNTPQWFVMKLRKGVSLEGIKESIDENLPGRLKTMELFYPTRTIYRDKGGKRVKEEKPYVSDLLFFRTRYNRIRSLIAKIGDMAWCMKESNDVNARYSAIPLEEMTLFQRCVGQFTDDIHITLVDACHTLNKGRMVRITGGMMKGYSGRIEDINEKTGTRSFFLRIANDISLKWTAEVEEAFIEAVTH